MYLLVSPAFIYANRFCCAVCCRFRNICGIAVFRQTWHKLRAFSVGSAPSDARAPLNQEEGFTFIQFPQ